MKDILFDFLRILLCFACINFPASADPKMSSIIKKNDTVYYNAPITMQGYERLKYLYYHDEPFSKIIITSGGGDYDAGMEMATLVYRNNIKIYVPQYCASACTFLFFGAEAKNRDIAPNALLGLHNVSFNINASSPDINIPLHDAIELAQNAAVRSGMLISFYSANGIPSDVLLKVSQSYGSGIVNIQREDLIRWGSIQK